MSTIEIHYQQWYSGDVVNQASNGYENPIINFLEKNGHLYPIEEIIKWKDFPKRKWTGMDEVGWKDTVKKDTFDPYINRRLIELWKD